VCHELNLLKSKQYKSDKYKDLSKHIRPDVSYKKVIVHTMEVSTLGFIADTIQFTRKAGLPPLPLEMKQNIIKTVLNYSYWIYCNRNSDVDLFPVNNSNITF